jgi:SAM-dependent methyltransferase
MKVNAPKQIVKDGYNAVSYAYQSDVPDTKLNLYQNWINEFAAYLPGKAAVLDLGCGCGVPATQILVKQGFAVTGVDISDVQIDRAKKLVPGANFRCCDMCTLDFASQSFAAIVSLYALIHIPLEEQPALFAKLFDWIQPGGFLLATVGTESWTGTEQNWLGVEGGTMYWSHTDRATYVKWLTDVGWMLKWDRFIPEGNGGHTLVCAKKPE